jgi:hypothetical protein
MSESSRLAPQLVYWLLVVLYLITWGRLSNEYSTVFDDGAFYAMAHTHNAGANFYDGIVDTKPPLLIYFTALGFRISPSISFIKWLSVAAFGVFLLVVYFSLLSIMARSDVACLAVTFFLTNWSLRHYGIVELSQSYWQTVLSFASLLLVFTAFNLRNLYYTKNTQALIYILLFLGGFVWAMAFYTKQQSMAVLPAVAALSLCYPWPEQTFRERCLYLSIFSASAIAAVTILYFAILGNFSPTQSYKYMFLSNVEGTRPTYGQQWWWSKTQALLQILSASLRIPLVAVGAVITIKAAAFIVRMFGHRKESAEGRPDGFLKSRGSINPDHGRGRGLVLGMGVWVLSVLFLYSLHGRAGTHYLLEIPVTLTVLIPIIISRYLRQPMAVMYVNVLILATLLVWHGILTDPVGTASRDKAVADRELAELIAKNTDKQDKILLFSNPVLYQLSDRLPASRFLFFVDVWASPLLILEYERAIASALAADTTKAVILDESSTLKLPPSIRSILERELTSNYRPLAYESSDVFGKPQIFIRETSTHPASSGTSVKALFLLT